MVRCGDCGGRVSGCDGALLGESGNASQVARIRDILKNKLDRDFTEEEIQLASEVDLFETAPIQKYVAKASHILSVEQRQNVLQATLEVFMSDGHMGLLERDYFDSIVSALDLKPSEMVRL